jgi:hemerythrin superfamily protein
MEQTEAMGKKNLTIYDLLKQDHQDVKKLFKQIIDSQRYQDSVYSQIKKTLTVHRVGEEKLLYPNLENKNVTRQLVLKSYKEHEIEKKMIDYVDMTSSNDNETRFAIVKMLSEAIDENIKEAEGDLFKKAKKVLSDNEENEIGRLFKKEKMSSM